MLEAQSMEAAPRAGVGEDKRVYFDDRVVKTSRKYEDVLSFEYSGSCPPYNFVNINLKLEKAD
jgi:hypothetical protein